jgi:CRISPR-associated protein (TIGR03986 family)
MTLPVHNNPTVEIAKAPYNFVPLPETVVTFDPQTLPCQNYYHSDRHTGYIDCTVTTESPVYVRAPLTPQEFERQEAEKDKDSPWRDQVRNKPEFFYTDPAKTPHIPGSSLRGMLRQLVEIAGYGKMEYVSDQHLVYRAVGDTTSHGNAYRDRIMRSDGEVVNRVGKRMKRYTPLVKAGYIRKQRGGDYVIQPAQEISGVTFARIRIDDIPRGLEPIRGCKNASHIHFQAGPYDYQDVRGGFLAIKYAKVIRASTKEGPGLLQGALALSGPMASKRTESIVFPVNEKAKAVEISDDLVRTYREQLIQEQKSLLGKDGVLNDGQPVFYLEEEGRLVFFGHTMMMRLPYLKSPLSFIPKELRREADLDLAEAIFGFTKDTGEGKARAYAGRVFVGDALLEPGQSNIWLNPGTPIVPKILGEPKPTTFQHYLTQPAPDPQAKGRDRNGNPKYVKELADYTAPEDRSVLRGHKLYWHKGEVTAAEIQEALDKLHDDNGRENTHDTQHTQMHPVTAGVRFRCRIRFENLSDVELGALLWALTLPGQPDKQYRHSIGMGKPLGMGAVKLDAVLFLDDRTQRYDALFAGTTWQDGSMEATAQVAELVGAFDRFMREKIGATEAATLAGVERIQMLLRMLEWPGPDKALTRYLEIERQDPTNKRGKINEYKGRPVLPDPLHIEGGGRRPSAPPVRPPAQSNRPAARPTPPAMPSRPQPAQPAGTPAAVSRPAPPKKELELNHPASIAEVVDGMYLEGEVVRIESGRIVVDILGEEASLPLQNIVPPSRDSYDLEERFPPEKLIKVIVRGRNKQGRLQLTMRRP